MSLPSCGHSASNYSQPASWIIDSGATNHMTFSSKSFSNYTPCSSSWKIITVASITVAGICDIYLSSSPTLKNVLHVPKLTTSPISVHRLLYDSNCSLTFLPHCCVFQYWNSGRTIGRAKESNGLHYPEEVARISGSHQAPTSNSFTLNQL